MKRRRFWSSRLRPTRTMPASPPLPGGCSNAPGPARRAATPLPRPVPSRCGQARSKGGRTLHSRNGPEDGMSEPRIAPFDWADPFALDAQLSDEERLVRDTAEGYAQERLLPRVTNAYLDEHF